MYYFQWYLETFDVQASVRAVNANIKTIIIQRNKDRTRIRIVLLYTID